MITGIKYLSPTFDHSGYGEASRNCIKALLTTGVPLTLQRKAFEATEAETYGKFGATLKNLIDKDIPYSHKIIHLTPEHYCEVKHRDLKAKNVGFMYWETDKIVKQWVDSINSSVDAQLVCCDYTKEALLKSGVTVPIYKILPPFDATEYLDPKPYSIEGVGSDDYLFYSIFQWTERKNPIGLLLAYLTEFTSDDKVALVLKTYRSNTSAQEQNAIMQVITALKHDLSLKNYPKICFIGGLLSKEQMLGLHSAGDCFVLPHRSEGLGMPHAEAMASGNPAITTGLGGNMEFTNEQNSYLLKYQMVPVCGMPWIPWYRGDQLWGEPDIGQLKQVMRYVYNNREEAKNKGQLARETIKEKLNIEKIGKEFIEVLEKI